MISNLLIIIFFSLNLLSCRPRRNATAGAGRTDSRWANNFWRIYFKPNTIRRLIFFLKWCVMAGCLCDVVFSLFKSINSQVKCSGLLLRLRPVQQKTGRSHKVSNTKPLNLSSYLLYYFNVDNTKRSQCPPPARALSAQTPHSKPINGRRHLCFGCGKWMFTLLFFFFINVNDFSSDEDQR